MGMLDCSQWKDSDFRLQTGLAMHDKYNDVSTEIFASMCHPRFSDFDSTDVNDESSDSLIKHKSIDQPMNEKLSQMHESIDNQCFSSFGSRD